MTKHTPGPWEVTRPSANSLFPLVIEVPNVAPIAYMAYNNAAINARLIAAAPDLLAALKGIMEWARRVSVANPGMEVANAAAAIAKATGEE